MSMPVLCYARKDDGVSSWSELVLLQDQSFVLSKKLIDIENIEQMRCDSTKTIFFPAEFSANASFFGDFKNFNGTFNAFDFYEGRLLTYDGTEIIKGSLYLINYDRIRNVYEVQIASKIGSVRNRLGTKGLDALTTYNHLYSWTNIKSSWNTNTGWQSKIKYMPLDNGVGVGDVINITTTAAPIGKLFYPSVNIKSAVFDIFDLLNLPFVDLSGAPEDAYVAIGGGTDLTETIDFTTHTPPTIVPYQGTTTYYKVPISSFTGEIGVINNDFIPQKSGYNVVDVFAKIVYEGINNVSSCVAIFDSSGVKLGETTPTLFNGILSINSSISVDLIAGESYTLKVLVTNDITQPLEVEYINTVSKGYVSVNSLLSRMKLYDIIILYRKLFDIYIIYNNSYARFEAHSYSSLTTAGSTLDWTDKIEYINDFKSGSLINYIASKYSYLQKKSKGLIDLLTFNKDGLAYGSFELSMPINSQQVEQKTELTTSTWVNSKYGGYKFFKNYETISEPKVNETPFVIGFFSSESTVTTYKVLDEGGNEQTYTKIGVFENTKNGLILAFNRVDQYADNANNSTSASLFKAFHWKKFNEWIGLSFTDGVGASLDVAKLKKARILDVGVWLTAKEFKTLTLGEKISITTPLGTDYFRILEVSGFDLLGRKPCNVKLIRIV